MTAQQYLSRIANMAQRASHKRTNTLLNRQHTAPPTRWTIDIVREAPETLHDILANHRDERPTGASLYATQRDDTHRRIPDKTTSWHYGVHAVKP